LQPPTLGRPYQKGNGKMNLVYTKNYEPYCDNGCGRIQISNIPTFVDPHAFLGHGLLVEYVYGYHSYFYNGFTHETTITNIEKPLLPRHRRL
jgi:hypothetical protein